MDSFYQAIFEREIYQQCNFALMSLEDFSKNYQENNTDRFWYSIQSFLVSCANISKLLWIDLRVKPLKNESKEDYEKREKQLYETKCRREALRKTLSVYDDSPLKSRSMRNNFEHFDKEIEKWLEASKSHNFLDNIIMNESGIIGANEGDFMRVFNTTKNAITFRGQVYELEPIIKEIKRLYLIAKKVSETPRWER